MRIPRLVVAGVQSSVGKTTVSIGLMKALTKRGFRVQAFKVGPDYIDPSYHGAATGRPCRNLDSWMVSSEALVEIFLHAMKDSDVGVVEGVMGLYDGVNGLDETGSTAQIAKLLRSPVILVLDAHKVARTAAAIVTGFKRFDPKVNLAGVILNRVANPKHAEWCKKAVETATKVPVVGAIPTSKEIEMPERHLGLIPTKERGTLDSFFSKTGSLIESTVQMDEIVRIATSTPNLEAPKETLYPKEAAEKKVRVAVALDEAFNFYYQDNLDLLSFHGAETLFFSPIHDSSIPDVDGVYLGGGFPEVLPRELEANHAMRKSVKGAAEDGLPIYAECGGLMYLTDSITDFDGNTYRMTGLFDGKTVMSRQLSLNYTVARVIRNNLLSKVNMTLKGHEFHYSKIIDIPRDASFAYKMDVGVGVDGVHDAWLEYSTTASYMHLHFAYTPKLVRNFIEACCKYRTS